VKRDPLIALVAIVVVIALCFGLNAMRPPFKPQASAPFSTSVGAPAATLSKERVIMRVNGEAVTEDEFAAAFAQLPEDLQRQFGNEQGKDAFAEQLIRLKILEQEARRLGVDNDPKVSAQLAADRTNILASAAAQKIVASPTNDVVQKFYTENRERFETVELSHILVAYAGGQVPTRDGTPAPQRADAMRKAAAIRQQLDAGVDFAILAGRASDDVQSVESGGRIGSVAHGMLPPELEKPVFALKEGEVSQPIASRFGIHIFKAGKHAWQPVDQVRTAISRRVQQQNTLDRVEVLRRAAQVEFDPKFFPSHRQNSAKKPS
jgi:parvulin-like peptidyl-prolyl isomerase